MAMVQSTVVGTSLFAAGTAAAKTKFQPLEARSLAVGSAGPQSRRAAHRTRSLNALSSCPGEFRGRRAGVCSRGSLVCRSATADGDKDADESGEGVSRTPEGAGEESSPSDASSEDFRRRMDALVENQGKDEAYFDGKELARLIFDKFGRSYDVTFMRQEFMGRKLLAMNIMWKYREQKSFPLSEAEYLTRLDLIAENLRFWGAVALVRQSLAATKERPRIGKAVSIRIDMDETGERSREWINR